MTYLSCLYTTQVLRGFVMNFRLPRVTPVEAGLIAALIVVVVISAVTAFPNLVPSIANLVGG